MALCRLVSRKLGSQLINNENKGIFLLSRTVTLKPIPAPTTKEDEGLSHDERNMRLGRPLSPHLTIYDVKFPMVLSGSHRLTGVIVGGYAILLGAGTIALPNSISHYLDALEATQIGWPVLLVTKFILAAPFVYHTCNGVRHIIWDYTARFLTQQSVYTTGYAVVACSSLITIALCAM